MNIKKNVTYVIKSFIMIKMKNLNLNYTKKLEITVILRGIAPHNIAFVI